MEKIETKIIKIEEKKHIFYCDNCNKKIGESIECEDGYYKEEGLYKKSFYIEDIGSYKLELHLCDECKKVYDDNIIKTLINIGFKKE